MHDSVAKSLHGIGLAAASLPAWAEKDDGSLSSKARELQLAAEAASQDARAILVDLRAETDDRTLAQQLRTLTDDLAAGGLQAELGVEGIGDCDHSVKRELVAIAAEAVENVRRHSRADRIEVTCIGTADTITLGIRDDGVGFDVEHTPQGHFGVVGIRERAQAIGAELELTSGPGDGTSVLVTAPRFIDGVRSMGARSVGESMPDAIRVLIVDDNAVVRMGLRNLLEVQDGIEVVGEADDGHAGVRQNEALQPDVVLCDVRMPGLDGVGAATQMSPTTNVLMLTYSDDLDVIRGAVAAGAKGYLVHGAHQPDEIVAAVVSASRGSSVLGPAAAQALLADVGAASPTVDRTAWSLTAREAEVMEHVARGLSNREIARACFLAEKTVKNHLNNIFPEDRRHHPRGGDEPVAGLLGGPVTGHGGCRAWAARESGRPGPDLGLRTHVSPPPGHLRSTGRHPRQRLEGEHHV